jgi:hypothetical protein
MMQQIEFLPKTLLNAEEPAMTALPCPDCDSTDRRSAIKALAAGATAALWGATPATALERLPAPRRASPAEALAKELFAELNPAQKKMVLLPFKHPSRHKLYNKAMGKTIKEVFTPAQTDLVQQIVKAMAGGADGYRLLSRGGTWDASKTFDMCGANFFGDPEAGPFAFVFTGHHLTIRCDGDAEVRTAFGGPIYYGHTPNGYSDKNIFYYQTQEVTKLFNALATPQREKALIHKGIPGEHEESVSFAAAKKRPHPGLACADMSADQKTLVKETLRAILSPYRAEDAAEVLQIIDQSGSLDRVHFAFYTAESEGLPTSPKAPWSYWRLEGPGFIWNYRVLPHVHAYVNIVQPA